MKIEFKNAGRRFNREWIFRHMNVTLNGGEKWVILGGNGSGKSTLLQVISGFLSPSEGEKIISNQNQPIGKEGFFRHIAYASPYLELFENYTLAESIRFHHQFKKLQGDASPKAIAEKLCLEKHLNKPVMHFSSGMKQRLKLGLALLSDTPVLLLDEPTSNMDRKGTEWYINMMKEFQGNRLIVVCSNHQHTEYAFCDRQLNMEDYKA